MALRRDEANNVTDEPLFRLYLQTKLPNPHCACPALDGSPALSPRWQPRPRDVG